MSGEFHNIISEFSFIRPERPIRVCVVLILHGFFSGIYPSRNIIRYIVFDLFCLRIYFPKRAVGIKYTLSSRRLDPCIAFFSNRLIRGNAFYPNLDIHILSAIGDPYYRFSHFCSDQILRIIFFKILNTSFPFYCLKYKGIIEDIGHRRIWLHFPFEQIYILEISQLKSVLYRNACPTQINDVQFLHIKERINIDKFRLSGEINKREVYSIFQSRKICYSIISSYTDSIKLSHFRF